MKNGVVLSLFVSGFELEPTAPVARALVATLLKPLGVPLLFPVFFPLNLQFVSQRLPIPRAHTLSNIAYQIFNIQHVYSERNMYLLHYTLCIM